MGLIIAAAFLAGSIFACLIVWLFMKGAHVDDPMDEAEANAPRDKFSCGYCGGSVDSRVLLPRRNVREQNPSGRKHFAED